MLFLFDLCLVCGCPQWFFFLTKLSCGPSNPLAVGRVWEGDSLPTKVRMVFHGFQRNSMFLYNKYIYTDIYPQHLRSAQHLKCIYIMNMFLVAGDDVKYIYIQHTLLQGTSLEQKRWLFLLHPPLRKAIKTQLLLMYNSSNHLIV